MRTLPLILILALAGACTPRPCPAPSPPPPPKPCPVASSVVKDVDPSGVWRVQWDRGPAGWWPRDFTGILRVEKAADGWSLHLRFDQGTALYKLKELKVSGDRVNFTLLSIRDGLNVFFAGWLRQGRLVGEMGWENKIDWTPFWGQPTKVTSLKEATAPGGMPAEDPKKLGLDGKKLEEIFRRAAEHKSSAVVILKDGKVAAERYRDGETGPVNAMSVSKSVTALAIGRLINEGKFNLDTRLSRLIKGWPRKGDKGLVTIRHLLNHTSGLDTRRAGDGDKILERGLKSKMRFRPGTRFWYNNNAVDLLAAVVKLSAGEHLDAYLERRIFKPMGITGTTWRRDPDGVPLAAGSLGIRPVDLAMIGQLMLQKGVWQGKQLVPRKWVSLMLKPGSPIMADCGLLWWRKGPLNFRIASAALEEWGRAGVAQERIKKVRALEGKAFPERQALLDALEKLLGKKDSKELRAALNKAGGVPLYHTDDRGPMTSFSGNGWLGQHLVVIPEHNLVAVRMRQSRPEDYKVKQGRDSYGGFQDDVLALVGSDKMTP